MCCVIDDTEADVQGVKSFMRSTLKLNSELAPIVVAQVQADENDRCMSMVTIMLRVFMLCSPMRQIDVSEMCSRNAPSDTLYVVSTRCTRLRCRF